eukprot:10691301-Ditylum_brightwellii.AAC.1
MKVNDENDVAATTSKTYPCYCSNSGPPFYIDTMKYPTIFFMIIPSVPSVSAHPTNFLLTAGWDAQINQGYCGLASVSALSNSLQFCRAFGPVGAGGSVSGVLSSSFSNPNIAAVLPVDTSYSSYKYATQRDLFGS